MSGREHLRPAHPPARAARADPPRDPRRGGALCCAAGRSASCRSRRDGRDRAHPHRLLPPLRRRHRSGAATAGRVSARSSRRWRCAGASAPARATRSPRARRWRRSSSSSSPTARSCAAIAEAAASDERIELAYRRGARRADRPDHAGHRAARRRSGGCGCPTPRAMAVALNLMNEAYLLAEFGREPHGNPAVAQATLETVWLRVLGPPSGEPPRRTAVAALRGCALVARARARRAARRAGADTASRHGRLPAGARASGSGRTSTATRCSTPSGCSAPAPAPTSPTAPAPARSTSSATSAGWPTRSIAPWSRPTTTRSTRWRGSTCGASRSSCTCPWCTAASR